MRELSLFSGAGGGLLATKHLLGWETVGYVEFDAYCQKVLQARIRDGYLDAAPIFGDIRKFIADGYADAYQGMVDVVSGGFPCQPFSVAGKRAGADDPRNMWPQTIETIRRVRPRFAFLENVPGLLHDHGYFGEILRDLAESGYDARWRVLSAAELGAPHRRDRLWIVAYNGCWFRGWWPQRVRRRLRKQNGSISYFRSRAWEKNGFSIPEPVVGGLVYGVAHGLERPRAIGNGQVPIVAATAWRILTSDLDFEYGDALAPSRSPLEVGSRGISESAKLGSVPTLQGPEPPLD